MALSADDADDRVEQLIALTERLTQILTLDAEDFEARRPHAAAGRAEETGRLANLYRHESLRVRRDGAMIAAAPAARREQLTRATEAMEAVLQRHARALHAAKTVTEGLVKALADEAAAQRAPKTAYGPGARMANTANASITLNRRA